MEQRVSRFSTCQKMWKGPKVMVVRWFNFSLKAISYAAMLSWFLTAWFQISAFGVSGICCVRHRRGRTWWSPGWNHRGWQPPQGPEENVCDCWIQISGMTSHSRIFRWLNHVQWCGICQPWVRCTNLPAKSGGTPHNQLTACYFHSRYLNLIKFTYT